MVKNFSNKVKLIVVLVVVLMVGSYFVTYNILYNKHQALSRQISENTVMLNKYRDIGKDVANFKSLEKELNFELVKFTEAFPPVLYQEEVIAMFDKLTEEGKLANLNRAFDFKDIEPFGGKEAAQAGGKDQQQSGGGDTNLVTMNVSTSFITNYSNLRSMLKTILENRPKVVANTLKVAIKLDDKEKSISTTDPKLEVKLGLDFLGYKDTVAYENLFKFEGDEGKDNIFSLFDGISLISLNQNRSSSDIIYDGTNNDFYVVMSPFKFEIPSIMAGKSKSGIKTVFQDINGIGNVEFRVERRNNGRYYYKYKAGNYTYPLDYSKMEEFKPVDGEKIVILVRGNHIDETPNNIGANLRIYNNADIPVHVVLTKLGSNYDRVKIEAKQGKVETIFN